MHSSTIPECSCDICDLMFSYTDVQLAALAIHYTGNKANGDQLQLSKELIDTSNESLKSLLLQYFLSPFKELGSYHLWHTSDLALNEIYHYASAIFDHPDEFLLHSCNIARQLFEATNLPNIKSGELQIVYLKSCPKDGKMTDAIGIYKTESKESFIKLMETKNGYLLEAEEGISPSKMDKGCIIFNTEKENGYKVYVVDKTNKGSEAQFWKDTFLQVRASADDYNQTNDYMRLCKDFILEQLPSEYEVERVDQIDYLNKSVDFFKKNDQFDQKDFEQEVFQQPELIESFRSYNKQYQEDFEVNFENGFDISGDAVKKQGKALKSVLKLDKNFHVYVHGDRSRIEKGYDAGTGLNFYKIYFEEEN